MMTTTGIKSKIYIAEERGVNELPWFRSYNTFSFGRYQHPAKEPAGNLYVLNDDTLEGDQSCSWLVEENSWLILLPVVGAIEYRDSNRHNTLLEAGQVQTVYLSAGTRFELTNPYADALINYLQLWVRATAPQTISQPVISAFDLSKKANQLLPAGETEEQAPFRLHIGKYDGRTNGFFTRHTPGDTAFAFVIQGAFELQDILLQPRDGLALWQQDAIEFEALSNDAILLLLELNPRF